MSLRQLTFASEMVLPASIAAPSAIAVVQAYNSSPPTVLHLQVCPMTLLNKQLATSGHAELNASCGEYPPRVTQQTLIGCLMSSPQALLHGLVPTPESTDVAKLGWITFSKSTKPTFSSQPTMSLHFLSELKLYPKLSIKCTMSFQRLEAMREAASVAVEPCLEPLSRAHLLSTYTHWNCALKGLLHLQSSWALGENSPGLSSSPVSRHCSYKGEGGSSSSVCAQ